MPRNLSASNKTDLARTNYVYEDIIELYLPATTLYYTTGNANITLTTPTTTGDQNFIVSNGVRVVGDLKENYLLTINEFTLILNTFDSSNTILSGIDTNLNKLRLVVYKLFRDPTNLTPDSANLLLIFDGNATSCSILGGNQAQSFQIQYRSIFNNFLGVKSRTNSELEPSLGQSLQWGDIIWK